MQTSWIHHAELILLVLLTFVVALASLAKRWKIPYPIVLVIGGLILSFVPGAPHLVLNPDMVFLVILPPLLFSAAFLTSWRDFKSNLVAIVTLAFGLVGFTVFGVAEVSRWLLPGFDWRMGLVLGAVVSTTDAIAATSIGHRLGLPKRIIDILEGESLLNDASGLLALEFATALIVSGHTPTMSQGAARLIYMVCVSIVLGLTLGKLIHFFEARIDDAAIEVTISLLAPYVAYLAAESLHASGVLATVACGLYLGHKSSLYFSMAARLRSGAVWDTLTFVLNGFVFVMIGLQLPYILRVIRTGSLGQLLLLGLWFSLVVIVLRILWVYPASWTANLFRRYLLHKAEPFPSAKGVFMVGWTGMRGVIALAAAISLPDVLQNGSSFPQREMIIFLTFCVIFVTLVLQGLTLPALIRRLGLGGPPGKNVEEEKARRAMAEAALAYLEHAREGDHPEFDQVYEELIRTQKQRLNILDANPAGVIGYRRKDYERFHQISQHVRALQRATILHLRNENEINDEVMRRLERELDLVEARFAPAEH